MLCTCRPVLFTHASVQIPMTTTHFTEPYLAVSIRNTRLLVLAASSDKSSAHASDPLTVDGEVDVEVGDGSCRQLLPPVLNPLCGANQTVLLGAPAAEHNRTPRTPACRTDGEMMTDGQTDR